MATVGVKSLLLMGITILVTAVISTTAAQADAQVMEPVDPGTVNSVSNQGL